jgi:hypothetical protein
MEAFRREERLMKVSVVLRWVGPAAIAGGVFLVLSDLSGLPITIPYLSTASPSGFDAVGSGVILIALTLLLVGMAGLYAKRPAPGSARVMEYGEACEKDVLRQPVTEEEPHETAGARRAGAVVLGAGLVMYFLLR